jgi:hypothetical protein
MSTEVITYVNKETGKFEKMDTQTGQIYKPEEFFVTEKKVKYNLADAQKICAFIRSGYPMAKIAQIQDLPDVDTIYFWKKTHPDFAKAIEEAREFAAESFASMAVQAAENATGQSKDELAATKLQVDTYRWMAEKMNPELYGNRTKVTGDSDQPLIIRVDTGIRR